jgi:cyclopropane fatty-acyl-phospholipid synthase-like methyltransferase
MTTQRKPYAEACDENGPHILEVLKSRLPAEGKLLEIGSGTGQHAVMFAKALPGIQWHTSDRAEMLPGIEAWLAEAQLANLYAPIPLDVLSDPWPGQLFDAAYSANTAHIMPEEAVEAMFTGVASILQPGAEFLLYGPFMYDGEHSSESNKRFDHWLRSCEEHRGIRDVSWLQQFADPMGLLLEEDIAMPVNNRILVWRRR